MPSKQVQGQALLPGMEQYAEAPSPMMQLIAANKKVAFGRVVMPYFFGLHESDYQDITEEMISAANPNRLLPYLIPGKGGHEGGYVVDGIALDSSEYQRIVRNPMSFVKNISNTTFQARALEEDLDLRSGAAKRSALHSLEEGKVPAMSRTLANIQQENWVIDKLDEEASHPGYAHYPIKEVLQWATTARGIIFERMLDVVGREKQWSANQALLARRSLDYGLFFARNRRVGNWRQVLKVAKIYGHQREALFANKIEESSQLLGRLALDSK